MKNLSLLYLSSNQISDLGATAIAASTNMINLSSLVLSEKQIGDAGKDAIRARFPLAFL